MIIEQSTEIYSNILSEASYKHHHKIKDRLSPQESTIEMSLCRWQKSRCNSRPCVSGQTCLVSTKKCSCINRKNELKEYINQRDYKSPVSSVLIKLSLLPCSQIKAVKVLEKRKISLNLAIKLQDCIPAILVDSFINLGKILTIFYCFYNRLLSGKGPLCSF